MQRLGETSGFADHEPPRAAVVAFDREFADAFPKHVSNTLRPRIRVC
jgi:hypothetical protein